jgi:hypothetical protein
VTGPSNGPVLPVLASPEVPELFRRSPLLDMVAQFRKALAADLRDVALLVRGLSVLICLAAFQGHRLIADRTFGLSSLSMAQDSV